MLQSLISAGLTDVIKIVVIGVGGFVIAYLKHHVDMAKVKKVETFLQSDSAAAELTKKVADDVKEVLTSQETEGRAAKSIAAFIQSKGGKATEDEIKKFIDSLKDAGKEVVEDNKTA